MNNEMKPYNNDIVTNRALVGLGNGNAGIIVN